ncbi:hypothetical protein CDL12_03174 [Handroanthus impetiginosus]|uniref:Uncharacterized protein n=1 Tax=Handroanthus impetiginosus TaxID=429701 RepID=A0A2G9I2Y8_9LAMI|nr:hypothetical protein CDL12_03174 [Handroanthus impetiginosus]
MALASCFCSSQVCVSPRIDCHRRFPSSKSCNYQISQRCTFPLKSMKTELFGQPVVGKEVNQCISWNFLGGSRTIGISNLGRNTRCRKSSAIYASWLTSSQIASSAFTWGTVAVLPFYTFMVVAPQAEFLPGIAKMFSSEMTLASAWIHLLVIDLFAARQVYFDGLQENVETRHSVSLCLLFCPIGILAHFITKGVRGKAEPRVH